MPRLFPNKLMRLLTYSIFIRKFLSVAMFGLLLLTTNSCGRVYFPIELKTSSRTDRSDKQQESEINVIPMTSGSIIIANKTPYQRHVVEAGNLKEPAKLVPASIALVENIPVINDPGPYLIGVGDVIGYEELLGKPGSSAAKTIRQLVVNEDGLINFFQLGRIKAEGKTLSQLEDLIFSKVVETGGNQNFNLIISKFRSKEILVTTKGVFFEGVTNFTDTKSVPYGSTPIYLEHMLNGIRVPENLDAKISILRGGIEYVLSYRKQISNKLDRIRIFPGDRIFINVLNYKTEKVLLVGETGAQKAISINSIDRPSLSDTIFSGDVLDKTTSDFSQIYVLREKKKLFHAYHLDITDPSRVSLASKFEMRPDDIIFVATQPLSLYSRTLSQILGSANLTLTARDTIRSEISN